MPIVPTLIAGVDDSSRKFLALIESFPLPTDGETGAFYHITTGLSRTALTNYSLLRRAFDDDAQDYMAWACRNLLEIAVFMRCVLTSKEKADEFASHRLIDGLDIVEKLKTLEELMTPNHTSSFDGLIAKFSQQMTTEGVVRKRFLDTSKWAKEVGLDKEFECINKVCSKFVHPTVWSILTEDIGSARFPDVRDLFYGFGALYIMDIYVRFKEHVDAHGLKHKPIQPTQTP